MSNKEKKKDIDDPKPCNVKLFTNCMIDASSKQSQGPHLTQLPWLFYWPIKLNFKQPAVSSFTLNLTNIVFNEIPYNKATVLWSKRWKKAGTNQIKRNWTSRSGWMKNVVTAHGSPCVKLVVL